MTFIICPECKGKGAYWAYVRYTNDPRGMFGRCKECAGKGIVKEPSE